MHQVGITGTRQGLTDAQYRKLVELLTLLGSGELHHGDCVGVDAQAHDIAVKLNYQTVIHPPINSTNRAFKSSPHILPPKDYLARNIDIISETSQLLAFPKSFKEEFRGSGTWQAIRAARWMKRKVTIVWPDGKALTFSNGEILTNER